MTNDNHERNCSQYIDWLMIHKEFCGKIELTINRLIYGIEA